MSIIRQWVSSVAQFSSQYDNTGWAATQVIGAPKVYPKYGDIRGAWASGSRSNNEFIEVVYEEKVYPTEINIYETYNAGGTKSISAKADNGEWVTLYQADKIEAIKSSRIFKPRLIDANLSVDTLKIVIDCSVAGTWVEIDAVELVGSKANPGSFL
ncbi:F-box/LRR-repeat protein 4-like isoform X2 [Crassostrea virginica]